jgi:FkbM family methyltransferase
MKRFFSAFNNHSIWSRKVELWGHTYTSNSFDRLLVILLHKYGVMQNPYRDWLRANSVKGKTILDIGANQGLFTLSAAEAVGREGRVHSFEPDLNLAESLKKNIHSNGLENVTIHNFALGSESGALQFFKNPYNSGDNRLTNKYTNLDNLVSVDVKPLDSLDEIRKFDLVKIDVQGWEPAVLEGMKRKLDRNPHAKILFEFWPYGLKIAGFDPVDFLRKMLGNGYLLREQGTGVIINGESVCRFVNKIKGKKYTDIEAIQAS